MADQTKAEEMTWEDAIKEAATYPTKRFVFGAMSLWDDEKTQGKWTWYLCATEGFLAHAMRQVPVSKR